MVFKNRNFDDTGLDRVAIKLLDAGLTAEYQWYSVFPIKKPTGDLEMKHLHSCNSPSAYLQFTSNQGT